MTPVGTNDLTGAIRYRAGFRGVLVLQVEERVFSHFKEHLPLPGVERTRRYKLVWRDAFTQDLRVLEKLDGERAKADDRGAAIEESIAAGARPAKARFRLSGFDTVDSFKESASPPARED